MPKISVIIPAYNSEQFIAQTFDSLLRQTLSDIEVIVVNDGSTDKTPEIIKSYCEKNGIFSCYTQANAGVSAARNFGLSKAKGEYVVFLDADDYYSDNALQAFYDAAKKTDSDIVIGRLATFSSEKSGFNYNEYADAISQKESISTFDTLLLWNFLVSNKCYRREFLISNGLTFPGYSYCEEGAFFMSAVFAGAKMTGTHESEFYYRRHTQSQGLSVSQTVSLINAQNVCGALEMIFSAAKTAVKKSELSENEKSKYLQEIIFKHAHILIWQFYRLMWQGSDDCAVYVAEQIGRLVSLMDSENLQKLKAQNPDIDFDSLPKTRSQAAKKASFAIIIKPGKGDMSLLFDSLYENLCPFFLVYAPKSMATSGKIGERYLKMENLVLLDDKAFVKAAKRQTKRMARVVIKKNRKIDKRTLRLYYKIPLPEKLKRLLFPAIFFALQHLGNH